MRIEDIKQALWRGLVHISDHADDEASQDALSLDEIYSSLYSAQIIEDYPTDRPYPSCLVMGYSSQSKPVHSVWAYNEQTGFAVLVTVYRPDPARWYDNYTERRSR